MKGVIPIALLASVKASNVLIARQNKPEIKKEDQLKGARQQKRKSKRAAQKKARRINKK